MFQRLSTDILNWIIIIGVILFIIELSFFNGGLIILAIFSGLLIYIGWKKFTQLWGKIVFWIGVISLLLSVLNMMAVRFLIVVAIVLFIVHYLKSKEEAEHLFPKFSPHDEAVGEPIFQVKPLFHHRVFGDEKTSERAYSWRDINIHGGFGDRIIDLSNTVLPDDTAVISVRHILGNLEIYVPYEVEVSIHHSSIFGKATILGNPPLQLLNETLSYQTEGYNSNYPRVKIITSLVSGDIEVKRI